MNLKKKIQRHLKLAKNQGDPKESKPRVLLAMSVANNIENSTHLCLINLFHSIFASGYDYAFHLGQSANIHRSRNDCVLTAYKSECSHILFIDSDMIFPDGIKGGIPSVFQQLLDRDKDIVGALCVRRKVPSMPTICNFNEKKNYFINILDWPEGELIEVDAIGTALLLVKVSVFDKISEKYFKDMPRENHNWFGHVTLNREQGSDYSFCIRARGVGYKIYCDTSIPTGHIGTYIYTLNDYLAFKKDIIEQSVEKEEFTKARLADGKEWNPGDNDKEADASDSHQEDGEPGRILHGVP